MLGVGVLMYGVGMLLVGMGALLGRSTLYGVATLLLGVAMLIGGVVALYRPELLQRVLAWLTKRDDRPRTADGDQRD